MNTVEKPTPRDLRPVCSHCFNQHWPTEGCIRPPDMSQQVRPPNMVSPHTSREVHKQVNREANAYTTPGSRVMSGSPTLLKEGGLRVSWTNGICDDCFFARFRGAKTPVRTKTRDREQCCDCGMPTTSGIYIREDPMTVRYPRVVVDPLGPQGDDV